MDNVGSKGFIAASALISLSKTHPRVWFLGAVMSYVRVESYTVCSLPCFKGFYLVLVASHQCSLVSIPGLGVICDWGLLNLLVLSYASRVFYGFHPSFPACWPKINYILHFFIRLGVRVGRHPWKTILIAVILSGACCAGMLKFEEENRGDRLWVPQDSLAKKHQNWVNEKFPSKALFSTVMLVATDVLTPAVFEQV